jgi:hypothetical protein
MSFGIVAVLVAGSASVFAKSDSARERAISGSIVRIDRNTRTIVLREQRGGQDVQVKVPAGSVLRTNISGLPAVGFEHLIVGMYIRDVRVQ